MADMDVTPDLQEQQQGGLEVPVAAEAAPTTAGPGITQEQYQQALQQTPPAAFAGAAATMACSPSAGAIQDPSLLDCILCDHAHTLTLFNHFHQAAEAGASSIMEMALGALAIDLRLHSQAETVVLYPVLSQRLGANGTSWAQRSLQEHMMVEQSVADCLALRKEGGTALANRVKQMQQEFMAHQAEEEQIILPALAGALTPAELSALAISFKAAKQTAPLLPQTPAVQAAAASLGPPGPVPGVEPGPADVSMPSPGGGAGLSKAERTAGGEDHMVAEA